MRKYTHWDEVENRRWYTCHACGHRTDLGDYLKSLNDETYHFVLLDSANNPEIIWNEFKLIAHRIVTNGILMVDDAGIAKNGKRDSTGAKKGYLIWDKLGDALIKIISSPHGTQLKIVFNKENKIRIMEKL